MNCYHNFTKILDNPSEQTVRTQIGSILISVYTLFHQEQSDQDLGCLIQNEKIFSK